MSSDYRLTNVLGTVYRRGNLVFSSDDHTLLTPIGNKVSMLDLRRHRSQVMATETRFDVVNVDINKDGSLAAMADDSGTIYLVSMMKEYVLQRHRMQRRLSALKFSPDSRRLAVAKESKVFIFALPNVIEKCYSPFGLECVLKGAYDDVTCLSWSSCSKYLIAGSMDMMSRVHYVGDRKDGLPQNENEHQKDGDERRKDKDERLKKEEDEQSRKRRTCVLGGHGDRLVGVFFAHEMSISCYTFSANGHCLSWRPSVDIDEEDDVMEEETDTSESSSKLYYKRVGRHFLCDHLPKGSASVPKLTSVDYNGPRQLSVVGFSVGIFILIQLPESRVIHSLALSTSSPISSSVMNGSGDWVALSSEHNGQLIVWEWSSESYVLKQQGHVDNMSCVAFAPPDGQIVATGSRDGKLKLWHLDSGLAFVTFNEHQGFITDLVFAPSGKFVVSSSLDGSVRAFDLVRYRNFRVFVAPRPLQFNCVDIDSASEMVAAGAADEGLILLWALKSGQLIEIVSGHEAQVTALKFSPSLANNSSTLVTSSLDKTLRIWDALTVSSGSRESIELVSDAVALDFRPDGNEVAVATLNGHISLFSIPSADQVGIIEGRRDLKSGRTDRDVITASKKNESQCFLTLCYSPDGSLLLAGGQSKNVCVYSVAQRMLVRRLEVTQNRSLDNVDEVVNRKKLSEFGNLALVEDRDEGTELKLPGCKRVDGSSRELRPEIRVSNVKFSPTSRDFAVASTEGVLLYSLDPRLLFQPFQLTQEVTPKLVREHLGRDERVQALCAALKLNEQPLIREAFESFETYNEDDIHLVVQSVPEVFVLRMAKFIAEEMDKSRHIHFYAVFAQSLLKQWCPLFRRRSQDRLPVLNMLHKSLRRLLDNVAPLCEDNIFALKFIIARTEKKGFSSQSKESTVNDAVVVEDHYDHDDHTHVHGQDPATADKGEGLMEDEEELMQKWSDDDDQDTNDEEEDDDQDDYE